MKFGFHISISGGFGRVIERAKIRGCDTIQLFSRNPRGWQYSPLKEEEIEKFKKNRKTSGIDPVFIHLPYLPNLASPKSDLLRISIFTLEEELRRAKILGADFVVAHMGAKLDSPLEKAISRISDSINTAFGNVKNNVILLLENTAGEGSEVGDRFSVIRDVIDRIDNKGRVGMCLDTAHAFEAGYDLSTEKGVSDTLKEFDDIIGLDILYLLHLNDSKTPLGSHRDLHWHIGEGYIGLEGFRNIVNCPLLSHLPGIMETPRKNEEDDIRNMKTIRRLVIN
ncbi:MAG: deoxyribonuclease IV [bacterium]|nr:deoxyribonuclease IV [bacterium]